MRRLIDAVIRLSNDRGFTTFQNLLNRSAYHALATAWAAGKDEVPTVEDLVNALDGKTYRNITLGARMIHGKPNLVDFDLRNKRETCELGDMVVISVVTSGRERLLQRVCIVQNKKVHAKRLAVDQTQLFLLKNFPPFTGTQGLVKGLSGSYRNYSGCLGAYGILTDPGEMVFASAPLLTEILRSRSSMQFADITAAGHLSQTSWRTGGFGLPFATAMADPDLWYYMARRYAGPFWGMLGGRVPFLGNDIYGRDVCDFVRGWTQINIGEVTHFGDATVEPDVDNFANRLIARAGLGGTFDTPPNEGSDQGDLEGGIGVVLYRMDVEH